MEWAGSSGLPGESPWPICISLAGDEIAPPHFRFPEHFEGTRNRLAHAWVFVASGLLQALSELRLGKLSHQPSCGSAELWPDIAQHLLRQFAGFRFAK